MCVSTCAVLLGSGSASAGGPTSAIVVNPANESAGALYHPDAKYETLLEALSTTAEDGKPTPSSVGEGPGSPSTVNVTWLIHDVSVWRVDRVDIQPDGTVWVRTYEVDLNTASGIDWASEPPWQQVSNPQAVIGVMNQLGVLDKTVGGIAEDPGTADAAALAGTPEPGSGRTLGWWWVLPSVAVGVVVGILGRPHLAALLRRRSEPGPRQQLSDA